MTVGDWPTEAREAVQEALRAIEVDDTGQRLLDWIAVDGITDAVLAALALQVQPRADDWEWAPRYASGVGRAYKTRKKAEEQLARWTTNAVGLVRRRPAGPWEVVP